MRYHKVGTTLDDDFQLVDRMNQPITGKVQGDFTISLNKGVTGNQASTGITITEVDATNNKGMYHITVNAATGFVSVASEYSLMLNLTADVAIRRALTYVVNSDGTGSGTVGAASFTATASDGRVTDGTSALASATVRIRNSSNVILYSFTTGVTGLWGPVYFDTAGTYTIDVQKSGYSSSSTGTIVVSGSTATGPLVDLALTAVSSGTGLTNSTLIAYARRMILDKVGSKADAEIQQAINEALDMISMERPWPWYLTHGDLNLVAQYSTGTVTFTAASTTVTLAGGTWPSWAASGKIKYNGKVYRISTRTSGAVVVLADAFQAATVTGATYILYQDEYTLPSDCMQFGKFFPGETWGLSQTPVAFEQIMQAYAQSNYGQEYPQLWANYKQKIVFWPYPQNANNLPMLYYRKPVALVSASDEADWDAMHVNLLHRAIDYTLSLRYPTVAGDPKSTFASYQMALARAVPNDKGTINRPSPLSALPARSRLRPIPAS